MAIPRDPGGAPRRPRRQAPRSNVFRQPLGPVGFQPVRTPERKLPPPAQLPSYPVKKHYTQKEQATIVRGTERAAKGVDHKELLAHPETRAKLEPYFRVKQQQQNAANRRYAKNYDQTVTLGQAGGREIVGIAHGMTPRQAGQVRRELNLRSQAQPRNLHSLLTDHGFDLSSYLSSPQHNLLAAGRPGFEAMLNNSSQLSKLGQAAGESLSRSLHGASSDVKAGRGGGAVVPGFLRAPLGAYLATAGDILPVAGRVAGGAAGDLTQYTLGTIPFAAMALSNPGKVPGSMLAGAKDAITHPLDHPLFALQIAHGAESAVARPIGAIGRSGLAGKRVASAFSTERAPLSIGGPASRRLVQYRHYSKDPLVKAIQAAGDRRLAEGPVVRNAHGREVTSRVAKDSKLASILGRDVAGRLRSHGDFIADRANSVERSNRAHMQRELLQALPTRERGGRVRQAVGGYFDRRLPASSRIRGLSRPEQGILGLVMSRVVRSAATFEHDLRLRLSQLEARAKHPFDVPEERIANKANQDAIRRVLNDPKAMANAERIVAAGHDLAKLGRHYSGEAVRQGALSPEAAARAPLFDYAMTHMGARYHTAEEHAVLERQALAHERTAAEHVHDLKAAGAPKAVIAQAQEVFNRVRDHRIAVSGRHPLLVERHERAKANVRTTARKSKQAQAEHARAEKARQRLLGAQSSRRGRRGAESVGGAVTKVAGERLAARATAAEKAKLAKADRRVAETKAKRQAAEAAHRDARRGLERAKLPDAEAGLRHGDGRYLSNEDIHAHMQANGVPVDKHGPVVSYLPHRPDVHDRGSYHRAQALLRRDSLEGYNRTGKAFAKGITGQGVELISDHLVRMGITTGRGAIGQFDQLAHDVGVKRHDGSYFTPAEAELEAAKLSKVPGQPELVPVRAFGAKLSNAQQALIRRAQDPLSNDPMAYGVHTDIGRYVEQAFQERQNMKADRQARNVVLMPKALVDRFQEHLTATAGRSPIGALLAKSFRTAVLPFSAKWLVGNVAEAIVRLAVIGANPLDYAAGRKTITALKGREAKTFLGREVLKQIVGLDAVKAGVSTEVLSSLLGGLFYGEKGLTIHRDSRDFEQSRLRVPAEAIGGLGKTTVASELGHTLMAVPKGIFAINRFIEQQAQITALGRYVRRDIQEFSKSYIQTVKLQQTAIEQAARGLFDTAQQRDAARFMDITLGQYARFSPKLRALIQTATPFLPWYLNSIRFVFWTMPISHPLTTAAILSGENAFNKDITAQHTDVPPGELKSAVPYHGGYLDLARYTPFGAFTAAAGGDLSTVTSPFFPQWQGVQHALEGKDPFGRDLTGPKTADNPQGKVTGWGVLPVAINQGIGGFVPYASVGQRLMEHGETPYSSSTLWNIQTKPDTSHGYSAVRRWLDPARPVFLKKKAASSGGSSSGWGRSSGSSSGWGSSSATTSGWGG